MNMNDYKVIIYNDTDMKYFTGVLESVDINPDGFLPIDTIDGIVKYVSTFYTTTITANNCEKTETIKLDETMMKRIAKFNKEQEIKQLDEIIKNKKEEMKQLEDIINDRDKRVNKLKNYIADLWNIDIKEDYEDWED